ncbi:MAG: nonspecific lipid-transfer protein [Deltaproteobacteria bacterium]|nr:nonspecific lipid-transfer protein [Deltaproteobacteria bacterium]
MKQRTPVIVGIGRTAYGRRSGRTTLAMAAEAAREALADAGLDATQVDGAATYQAADSASPMAVADAIGSPGLRWNIDLMGGGNYASSVVTNAAMAIECGLCDTAIVYRSLNGRSGRRFGRADGVHEVGGALQFTAPQGYMTPPQWMAMWAREHQQVYGSTCEDLGAIAVTQRRHAVANEHAVQRDPITIDDYLAARWINEPLRLYDCALEIDGAVALVLATAERAADLRRPPVGLHAHAEFTGAGGSWERWPDLTTMYSKEVAPALWDRSGLRPADVDVACMYDCFTYTVMVTLEEFGFCERGEVGDFLRSGRGTYGGDVVVNPHGGLLSEGYIHGLNHTFEAVLQLRGDAGERQVEGAEVALVTAGAGPYGGAMLLGVAE